MKRPQPGDHVIVTTSRYRGREAVLLSYGSAGLVNVQVLPTPHSQGRHIAVKSILPVTPRPGEDREDDPLAEMAQLMTGTTARGSAWVKEASCATVGDPELFFPEITTPTTVSNAKMVCANCPVRPDCLREALLTNPDGVWGGTTKAERRAIQKRKNYHATKYHCFDPQCEAEFTVPSRAGEHYSKVHMNGGVTPKPRKPCAYCERTFAHNGALMRHVTTKHKDTA